MPTPERPTPLLMPRKRSLTYTPPQPVEPAPAADEQGSEDQD